MAKKNSKKSKAQKRFDKQRRTNLFDTFAKLAYPRVWGDTEDSVEEWHCEQMQKFSTFCELIYSKMLEDTDSVAIDPLENKKNIWNLAQIAWNLASTTESLEESVKELTQLDKLPVSPEMRDDIKEQIIIMLQILWALYPDCDSIADDIEFTLQPDGKYDVAVTFSRIE